MLCDIATKLYAISLVFFQRKTRSIFVVPFPREEIAALPPSTTQQGGHTAPDHPNQEAPIAAAAQHSWHTAPPPTSP